jgi:MFS family permease
MGEAPPQSRHEETDARHPGWRVAIGSGVGVFFASLVVVTFPVFLKPWTEAFGWSRREVSLAFGVAAASAGLFAPILGALLDRLGARRIALPCLALLGIQFASLAALGPRLDLLYLLFALLGLAAVGTSPVAYARAVSTWFSARRGFALALVVTGGALGGIVFPVIATALVRRIGWRGTCLVLGVAALAVGLPLVARWVRERPAGGEPATWTQGATFAAGVRTRMFWVLVLVQFCGTMVQNSVIVHLSALLTDRGIPPERAAIALSGMAASAVLGRLVTGWWLDRVFAPRLLLGLLALAGLGAWLLSGATTFGVALAAAMLVGFGTGGEADVIPYLLSRYHGLRAFASLFGVVWLANAIGGALGPVWMGRSFDISGTYGPTLFRLALVALGAAGWTLLLPRYGAATEPGRQPASAAAGS